MPKHPSPAVAPAFHAGPCYRSSGAIFSLARPLTHRRGTQHRDAGWSISWCGRSSSLSSIGSNVAVARRSDKRGKKHFGNGRVTQVTFCLARLTLNVSSASVRLPVFIGVGAPGEEWVWEPAGAPMRSMTLLLSAPSRRASLRLSLNFRRRGPLASELFDVRFQGPADL